MKFTLGAFRPEALVKLVSLAKYRQRLTLSAGEIPALTLSLKPGEDSLDASLELVDDLRSALEA